MDINDADHWLEASAPSTAGRVALRLGNLGIEAFSRLGVGCAQFGNLGRPTTDEDVAGVIDETWASGLRYFDTAPHYGLGLSERRLGEHLQSRPRDAYLVSTKVGRLLRPHPEPTHDDMANGFDVPGTLLRKRDYSAMGMRRSLEESLERMGLDRVDILWIHDPEEPTDLSDVALASGAPELERMREEGLISAWGVGSKNASIARRFVDESSPDLIMLSGRYTLIEQEQVGLLERCAQDGVGVVAVSVFNSGLLASPRPAEGSWYEYGPAPKHILARARAIAAIAEKHGIDLPTAALHFPRRHPAVVNVNVGMRTAQQARTTISRAAAEVPEAFWEELAAASLPPGPDPWHT